METGVVSQRYAQHSGTIWEKIGAHIVIASLENGKYCSLDNESSQIAWEMLMMGYATDEIQAYFASHYPFYTQKDKMAIADFIAGLADSGLIIPYLEDRDVQVKEEFNRMPSDRDFVSPRCLIYSDIDSVLILDPIDDELAPFLTTPL